MNITVSAYNRPAYLRETLAALRQCDGIEQCRVMVLVDPSEASVESAALAVKYGFQSGQYPERIGCNLAIREALAYGFNEMQSEFHVHLEDDTVPTRDCLRWFAWARDHYRDDPAVMNVSGYQRISNGCLDECGLRRWFTPWGWGVWRDRWLGLHLGWVRPDAETGEEVTSWDVIVNHALRAGRYEAFPTVSRIQNIGAEKGTHVPSAEWHAEHHRVAVTADHITGVAMPEAWRQVRRDERADHA
jgi:hypothetical protein